jgi:hypothetical protein
VFGLCIYISGQDPIMRVKFHKQRVFFVCVGLKVCNGNKSFELCSVPLLFILLGLKIMNCQHKHTLN